MLTTMSRASAAPNTGSIVAICGKGDAVALSMEETGSSSSGTQNRHRSASRPELLRINPRDPLPAFRSSRSSPVSATSQEALFPNAPDRTEASYAFRVAVSPAGGVSPSRCSLMSDPSGTPEQ